MVIHSTTLFNLQCNNVAFQVVAICCSYYFTLSISLFSSILTKTMYKSKLSTFPSFHVFMVAFVLEVSLFIFYYPGNWSNARGSLNVLEKGIHENHGSGQGERLSSVF